MAVEVIVEGIVGPPGPQGPQGEQGVSVPDSGSTRQTLLKTSDDDYDFEWGDLTASDVGADPEGSAAAVQDSLDAHISSTSEITDLPDAAPLDGSEEVPVDQGGDTVRASVDEFKSFITNDVQIVGIQGLPVSSSLLHGVWASDSLWTPPADGAGVSSLRNMNYSAVNPVQATVESQPLFDESNTLFNDRSTIHFDGTNDYLTVDITDRAQPFTVVAVLSFHANVAQRVLGRGVAATSTGVGFSTNNELMINFGTSLATDNLLILDEACVVEWYVNGATSTIIYNGFSAASGNAGSSDLRRFTIGAGDSGSAFGNYFNGDLAFLWILSKSAPDYETRTLRLALASYYNIPLVGEA